MRTSPVPFSLSGIAVIAGMFGGGADCAKLRVPPRAVIPAVAQAARPRKPRRLWSDVVMTTLLIRRLRQFLAGTGAGERRRYPPFVTARSGDIFRPSQIDRRHEIAR